MQRMSSRTLVVAGATAALIGAFVVVLYARGASTAGAEDGVPAFVATKDIGAGTKAASLDRVVADRSVPAGLRPANAVDSLDQIAGRTSVRSIAKGEVITASQFGVSDAAPGAGLEIPKGFNAVTINVGPPQGVAHHAQTGDLVNVYATLRNQPGGTLTKLLLSNVQVLANRTAVAQDKAVAGGGEVVLTLALEPSQAEKVIFAKETGSLWFGLVRPGDGAVTTGAGRTSTNVLK